MATTPQANLNPELEYYRSRAKEFRDRYESMRDLEWKTLLQTYTGYAAIAVAFQQADLRFNQYQWWVRFFAMVLTLVFFDRMHYLHYRIEERLITFDETYDHYISKTVEKGRNEDNDWGTSKLGHLYFWLVRRNRGWNRVPAACQVSDRGRVRGRGMCGSRTIFSW